MRRLSLSLFFLLAIFLAGCSTPQQPLAEQTPSSDGATVEDIQQDLTGLDTLDEDLDISDLEGIEDDLNVDF